MLQDTFECDSIRNEAREIKKLEACEEAPFGEYEVCGTFSTSILKLVENNDECVIETPMNTLSLGAEDSLIIPENIIDNGLNNLHTNIDLADNTDTNIAVDEITVNQMLHEHHQSLIEECRVDTDKSMLLDFFSTTWA